ncbi:hypothetical protein SAMN04488531_0091 [Corynebacterium coyleae]|mgnify:FL=1|uniref:Uncharacterized protein n=1 Tax=Corynebacterium coyleae TaxID=53374 RepID=A0ABX8KVI3_9CORY|nr:MULTISPECIES: hypothetical protein [Corynebacterium]OHO81745.1 hypothetical protein HMPREF2736_05360 [Corynebacterium sp. HMSC036E10]MDK8822452.1 hypothetical protein [Corynebacterium coyleae]OFL17999.1 hypothetical protein HMPREF2785_06135 [Corynebacterium sp. HMSC067D03]OFO36205.1 hypothetical protein HMPREF3048_05460 [Corynebacterium sp. HMSC075D04]OFT70147.1 hypothetical protein HMPREF3145_05895 [Corynebacterium sp. HMSC05C01]
MNATSWLGLAFVIGVSVLGLFVLWRKLREIQRSDLDDDAKRRWGLLFGISPLAGLFTWNRREELLGHRDDSEETSSETGQGRA